MAESADSATPAARNGSPAMAASTIPTGPSAAAASGSPTTTTADLGTTASHQLQHQLDQHIQQDAATAAAASTSPGEAPEDAPEDAEEQPVVAGYLASRLNTVFGNALAHTLKVCSYANFAACFPTPASRRPETLRSVWQQIVGKIEAKARSEYGGIMAERDVVRGLNELERLIGEAKRRKEAAEEKGEEEPVAPHTLSPESLYAANLAPELEPIRASLQRQIDTLSAENEQLATGIEGQRAEVETLLSQLEATVKDLEGANEALEDAVGGEGSEHADIREEIVEAQEELRRVRDRV